MQQHPHPQEKGRGKDPEGYQVLQGAISCILGGSQAPTSNQHFKLLTREVAVARPGVPSPKLKWSQCAITFDARDHPISTRPVGTLPMICTPTINNIVVAKTLIDGGADLNVISTETFPQLQVPYDRLMLTMSFSGVTSGSTIPIGQVCISVMFGTHDNYRTELIDFDMAHINLPYNVILRYPVLAKFMAATHYAYNMIKMPSGNGGVITIRCDKVEALRSLEHAYKTAVATYPEDVDALDYAGGSTRRKQMMAQENTMAKRATTALLPPRERQDMASARDLKRSPGAPQPALARDETPPEDGDDTGVPNFPMDCTQRVYNNCCPHGGD